ncbi:hypothetical protein LPJ53_003136 [Coemansia erecta]|uniref:DUF1000-domain-containing protein n=1 Tax=Coemansia erecta TaxID=147472 RepID=A0A9W7Y0R8_9FUNG|nr:hypothetical protein LPJ53_003136 [Coemansia erecta]
MAINVNQTEQFVEILRDSANKLIVVDFYSQTCPPCALVDRILEPLVTQYPQVGFYKVDIHRFPEVAEQCRITATPTLQFYKRGRNVNEVRGANKKAIIDAIDAALASNGEAGQSAYGVLGHIDLTSVVLKTQSECLNQNDSKPLENVWAKNDSVLESDVDEQMVLHVAFNQPIKLHSIMLRAPLENAPRSIKIFANRTDIGFDDADSAEPTQEIEMTEEMYKSGGVVGLRYVRFQNVNSVSIFVADNLGDEDVTAITQLAFIGTAVNTANMSDIKQNDDGHGH